MWKICVRLSVLSEVDMIELPKLQILNFIDCGLTRCNVSKVTSLQTFLVIDSKLMNVDVTALMNLEKLTLSRSQIENINL